MELGGTSGYRVGRGRCYCPWAVERLSVEPALPLRVPLHCTASRRVHALRTLSSGHRQRAWQCLGRNTSGFQDTSGRLPGLAFCRRVAGFPPSPVGRLSYGRGLPGWRWSGARRYAERTAGSAFSRVCGCISLGCVPRRPRGAGYWLRGHTILEVRDLPLTGVGVLVPSVHAGSHRSFPRMWLHAVACCPGRRLRLSSGDRSRAGGSR